MWKIIDANLERLALLVFYSMLVLTMSIEVLRREVLAYSSVWGEEIVRYSFIYLVWIGCALAVKSRAHISIDILPKACSNRVKLILYVFSNFVMLTVSCFALYWGIETLLVGFEFGAVSHGLRVPMVWFLFAVPMGFVLIIYRLLQVCYQDCIDLKNGNPAYEGDKLFD